MAHETWRNTVLNIQGKGAGRIGTLRGLDLAHVLDFGYS